MEQLRKVGFVIIFSLLICSLSYANKLPKTEVISPDLRLMVVFKLGEDGAPLYEIFSDGVRVLEPSKLGMNCKDQDFASGLRIVDISNIETVEDHYQMKVGKFQEITYHANKRVFSLANSKGSKLDVIFQVSDDGVVFRYYFPELADKLKYIEEELTTFHFSDNTKAWLQPCSDAKTGWARTNPSYEENYLMDITVGTPSPTKAGWVYPALFKSGDKWIAVTESGLKEDYCATRLQQKSKGGEYRVGFPQKEETCFNGELKPQASTPWYTPWRVIAIGSLKTIIESTLGTDVADSVIDGDFSWVKPGRSSWSWVLLKDEHTNYETQKQFIDYAAIMGWEYCLIDALWDTQIGYEKIATLADYARTKNVGILLWYNSAGKWNDTYQTPKDIINNREARLKEFKRIKSMGIKGLKIDFFGGDGQSVIQYYHDILNDAAEVGLMVNFHGCTLPRGWQRTYPNLLTMEAVKGMEFITFEQANANKALSHCAMLPFARNLFDPMDFTPVCFSEIPNIQRNSTNGFELALSIIFTSGIQHYAETATGMAHMPDYVQQAMKDVPVSWEETVFVDGYPGKYVVLARRKGEQWYVAGINAEQKELNVKLDLGFIKGKKVFLITDGDDSRRFRDEKFVLPKTGMLELAIKSNGGFWLQISE